MPQGVVPLQGWNPYNRTGNDHNNYRNLQQNESGSSGGIYTLPRDNVFLERPGQPECQFYVKTGDCKFGTFLFRF
ncbi:unnamed protein product [Eruca vesicaria subsp. sativa]|uniref:C3H1-type domain-containing protein n=1 Tax=Eruca vesicaria subsp. sativa TaxID=29727 RepID=A0ABC8LXX5_ERUVS|nr:unnamed protein product [Eruca vesicaria subsp. sativa]